MFLSSSAQIFQSKTNNLLLLDMYNSTGIVSVANIHFLVSSSLVIIYEVNTSCIWTPPACLSNFVLEHEFYTIPWYLRLHVKSMESVKNKYLSITFSSCIKGSLQTADMKPFLLLTACLFCNAAYSFIGHAIKPKKNCHE